jgi:hypothetical protein
MDTTNSNSSSSNSSSFNSNKCTNRWCLHSNNINSSHLRSLELLWEMSLVKMVPLCKDLLQCLTIKNPYLTKDLLSKWKCNSHLSLCPLKWIWINLILILMECKHLFSFHKQRIHFHHLNKAISLIKWNKSQMKTLIVYKSVHSMNLKG